MTPAHENRDRVPAGIAMLVVATLFFAAQDTLTKQLVTTLPASQIVAIRFFFFAIFATLYAARRVGLRATLRTAHPVMQVCRGLLIGAEIIVFAYAIRYLGLAEMHTLFACFPLMITALSVPVLGEEVGWRRWLAVGLGFAGTAIILRPGFGVFEPAAGLALLAAFMFSVYNVMTRRVARRDRFETSLLYMGLFAFAASLTVAPFYWQPVNAEQVPALLTLSATAIVGHLLLMKSLELAPAVILQPFNYFVLVWAIVIGYFFFGEVLPATSVLGAALVVGSGVFIARREYRLQRARSKSSDTPSAPRENR